MEVRYLILPRKFRGTDALLFVLASSTLLPGTPAHVLAFPSAPPWTSKKIRYLETRVSGTHPAAQTAAWGWRCRPGLVLHGGCRAPLGLLDTKKYHIYGMKYHVYGMKYHIYDEK